MQTVLNQSDAGDFLLLVSSNISNHLFKVQSNYESVLCWDELYIVTDVECAVKTLAGDLLRALANFEM